MKNNEKTDTSISNEEKNQLFEGFDEIAKEIEANLERGNGENSETDFQSDENEKFLSKFLDKFKI